MQDHNIYVKPKMYDKPHKFFERYLDNDLNKMTDYMVQIYKDMQTANIRGISPVGSKYDRHWIESGSISTVKWTEYNVFQFFFL